MLKATPCFMHCYVHWLDYPVGSFRSVVLLKDTAADRQCGVPVGEGCYIHR
jgi:hypothetical protein